jgi:hypothetical protein
MFSGHTYVISVFALGVYDAVCSFTANLRATFRVTLRGVVGLALLALVALDVTLILMNRFHYTMDCVIALVLALLLYSSPAAAIAIEVYEALAVSKSTEEPANATRTILDDAHSERDHGSLLIPPCCVPLCCFCGFFGRYHLHRRPLQFEISERKRLKAIEEEENKLAKKMEDQQSLLERESENCRQTQSQLKQVRKDFNDKIRELDSTKTAYAEDMRKFEKLLSDRTRSITELEQQLREKDQVFTDLRRTLELKDQELQKKDQELQTANSQAGGSRSSGSLEGSPSRLRAASMPPY